MLESQVGAVYTDFQGLGRLRAMAKDQSPETLRAVAVQFEALFIQMMLKNMREAGMQGGMLDSDQSLMYRDLFDQQMSLHLAQGSGVGIAGMLLKQLGAGSGSQSQSPMAVQASAASLTGALPPGAEVSPGTGPLGLRQIGTVSATPYVPEWLAQGLRAMGIALPSHVPAAAHAPKTVIDATNLPRSQGPEVSSAPRSPEEFIRQLWPYAERAAQAIGVSAQVLLAQAALETGWGRSVPRNPDGSSSHNLFGIKADASWQGAKVGLSALEYIEGVAVRTQASFRAYSSFAESFTDYVDFLRSNPRYTRALQLASDPESFVHALQEAGYATDPAYARKVMSVLRGDTLTGTLADLKLPAGRPLT